MALRTTPMISAARTNNFSRSGFTLLEIVIVLAIAAVITGGALAMMYYSSDERVLRDTSGEVEVLAKRARTAAILQQTPYALEFNKDGVRLLPLAEAGRDDRQILDDVGVTTNDDVKAATKYKPIREQYYFPKGMQFSILRWNATTSIPLIRDAIQIWRFDPDGLCEPVSLRYAIDKGWAEDSYHPLTASIRDSQLEVR